MVEQSAASMTRSLFRRLFLCLIAPCFLLTQRTWKKVASFPVVTFPPVDQPPPQPQRLRRKPQASFVVVTTKDDGPSSLPRQKSPPQEQWPRQQTPKATPKPVSLLLHHMTAMPSFSTDDNTTFVNWIESVTIEFGYRVVWLHHGNASPAASPPCRNNKTNTKNTAATTKLEPSIVFSTIILDKKNERHTNNNATTTTRVVVATEHTMVCGENDDDDMQTFWQQMRQSSGDGVILLDTTVAQAASEDHDSTMLYWKHMMEWFSSSPQREQWKVLSTVQAEPYFVWLVHMSRRNILRQQTAPDESSSSGFPLFPPNVTEPHYHHLLPPQHHHHHHHQHGDGDISTMTTAISRIKESLQTYWDNSVSSMAKLKNQGDFLDAKDLWKRVQTHINNATRPVAPGRHVGLDCPLWPNNDDDDDDKKCIRAPPLDASLRHDRLEWCRQPFTRMNRGGKHHQLDDDDRGDIIDCSSPHRPQKAGEFVVSCPNRAALEALHEISWQKQLELLGPQRADWGKHRRAFRAVVETGVYCATTPTTTTSLLDTRTRTTSKTTTTTTTVADTFTSSSSSSLQTT
eukprot:scaffold14698_cov196-Amphora_coffeaeformis.AAC.7